MGNKFGDTYFQDSFVRYLRKDTKRNMHLVNYTLAHDYIFPFSEKELYYSLPSLLYFFLYFPILLIGLVSDFLSSGCDFCQVWEAFKDCLGAPSLGLLSLLTGTCLKGRACLWSLCLGMRRHSLEQTQSRRTAFVWTKVPTVVSPLRV